MLRTILGAYDKSVRGVRASLRALPRVIWPSGHLGTVRNQYNSPKHFCCECAKRVNSRKPRWVTRCREFYLDGTETYSLYAPGGRKVYCPVLGRAVRRKRKACGEIVLKKAS